jgi:hypothetical protein
LSVDQALSELLRISVEITHIAAAYGEAKLDQLVVDAQGGAVFAVGDGTHVIVALADHRPAVGLIFYDLRACLADAFATEQSA